jgi:SAM-dependent methyltransferase
LYAHRGDNEAADFIDSLVQNLNPPANASVIDVGCGAGRHCKILASKGLNVTGIDLAFSSIRQAKKSERPNLHFFQHDMRVAFGRNTFDYVFNVFTSFGYFRDERENNKVIENMAAALKPGGKLILDYLNVPYAENHLVTAEHKEIDGTIYNIARWMDDEFFYKAITFKEGTVARPYHFIEQVAKFKIGDFERMFATNHLKITAIYGDYKLQSYVEPLSPRLILIAEKAH